MKTTDKQIECDICNKLIESEHVLELSKDEQSNCIHICDACAEASGLKLSDLSFLFENEETSKD